jgi:Co/Zn/Cd efflux system component
MILFRIRSLLAGTLHLLEHTLAVTLGVVAHAFARRSGARRSGA